MASTPHLSPTPIPAIHRHNRWIEAGLIIGFWTCLFILSIGRRAFDPRGPEGLAAGEWIDQGLEYLLWMALTPGIFWLISTFGFGRKVWPRHLLIHLGVAGAVTLGTQAFSLMTYTTFIRGGNPRLTLLEAMQSFFFLDELILYLIVLSAGFARSYFLRYRQNLEESTQLRTETAELQIQLAQARLRALHMQLNPHFLFNTLNAVSVLVERDPKGVRKMIGLLSELLRYTLDTAETQEVTLEQELGFTRSYLQIQEIRFQENLNVDEEIDSGLMDAMIPNLILQPLVENAIKHGVSRIEGAGQIRLLVWREEDELHIAVEDNGPGLGAQGDGMPTGTGVGLSNTIERLERLYGPAQSLQLGSCSLGGLRAHITLPYHTRHDLSATGYDAA